MDNRRLYVFRVLNVLGLLKWIQIKKVNHFEREMTTENDGCHVRVRNRRNKNGRWMQAETYRHCSCYKGQNMRLPSKLIKLTEIFSGDEVGDEIANNIYLITYSRATARKIHFRKRYRNSFLVQSAALITLLPRANL